MNLVHNRWQRLIRLFDKANGQNLRAETNELGTYDLHHILRQQNRIEWNEWHLHVDGNDNAIQIAENFHNDFQLKESSSIRKQINIIKKTFLEFKSNNKTWNEIKDDFEQANKEDHPKWIIKAYTRAQTFSKHINIHSAVNTKHTLKLYCTLLNCPILSQTQQYTEAITKIFFHPKLKERLVSNQTVYRGTYVENEKLVADYKEGVTIITTTFLSTSAKRQAAELYLEATPENALKIFCIYNIKNTTRHTAIDIKDLSQYPEEDEVIILRYIPFRIRLIQRIDDDRKIEIHFDECEDEYTIEETCF